LNRNSNQPTNITKNIENFNTTYFITMMNFQNNKTKISSLILLGSLASFPTMAEGAKQKQYLRRKAQEFCTPFVPRQSPEETFTYLVLEFENIDNDSLYAPDVNVTKITEIYNNLVDCNQSIDSDQLEVKRRIKNTSEFMPKALPLQEEDTLENPKVLIEVQDFDCNACGTHNFKLFYDDSDLAGAENINAVVCDCRGPSSRDFIARLIEDLGFTDLKNVTQIPLLHPSDCDPIEPTTFSYAGVCPGSTNRKFDFFTPPPTGTPSMEPSNFPTEEPTTEEPTHHPTDMPTDGPTDEATSEPTEKPTPSPTGSPTKTPTEEPTGSPTSSPTITYTKPPVTDAPSNYPTISPTTWAPTESEYPTDNN